LTEFTLTVLVCSFVISNIESDPIDRRGEDGGKKRQSWKVERLAEEKERLTLNSD